MELTDEAVMRSFQAGDRQALQQLFQRYKLRILNFCLRLLGNRADAEEISADVFLTLLVEKDRFDPTRKFSTWLYTIARNKCMSRLRTRGLLIFEPASTDPERSDEWEAPDLKTPAWEELAKEELAARVQQAIERLPDGQKAAIILRHYHEFSYDEIGQIMDCSLDKVKILIFRARARLRLELAAVLRREQQ